MSVLVYVDILYVVPFTNGTYHLPTLLVRSWGQCPVIQARPNGPPHFLIGFIFPC
jgi:hypothetical protein